MDRRVYDKIAAKWKGPAHYNWPAGRMEAVAEVSRLAFAGRTVVDIGCNAGLLTYEIAQHAKGYIGVEKEKRFFEQALITKRFIQTPGVFLNCKLRRFLARIGAFTFDAVFGCRVLYHLRPQEIAGIEKLLLPRCSVAVFVSREDKRGKRGNEFNLHRVINIRKFLEHSGFVTEVAHRRGRCYFVVGRRS